LVTLCLSVESPHGQEIISVYKSPRITETGNYFMHNHREFIDN
jgi:hypothetical protein